MSLTTLLPISTPALKISTLFWRPAESSDALGLVNTIWADDGQLLLRMSLPGDGLWRRGGMAIRAHRQGQFFLRLCAG